MQADRETRRLHFYIHTPLRNEHRLPSRYLQQKGFGRGQNGKGEVSPIDGRTEEDAYDSHPQSRIRDKEPAVPRRGRTEIRPVPRYVRIDIPSLTCPPLGVENDQLRIETLLDEVIRARTRINLLFMYGPEGYIKKAWLDMTDSDEEPEPKKQKTDGSGAGASQESEDSSSSSD